MSFREFDWIAGLTSDRTGQLKLGIGDDAALFEGAGLWAISTDSLVEGVHFLETDAPGKVAHKCVAVNFSDMAAMGCRPRFFLLNLHVPARVDSRWLEDFKTRLYEDLREHGVSLIGGDTCSAGDGRLSLVGTVLGQPFAGDPVLRSGAKCGDTIVVTGAGLGGSYPQRHLDFSPRLAWSEWLCRHLGPSAMMDISDGLLQDLGHILKQSGVGAELDLWRVPIHPEVSGEDRLERALRDGEDFELLFTCRQEAIPALAACPFPLHAIGTIVEQREGCRGRKTPGAAFEILHTSGWEHRH